MRKSTTSSNTATTVKRKTAKKTIDPQALVEDDPFLDAMKKKGFCHVSLYPNFVTNCLTANEREQNARLKSATSYSLISFRPHGTIYAWILHPATILATNFPILFHFTFAQIAAWFERCHVPIDRHMALHRLKSEVKRADKCVFKVLEWCLALPTYCFLQLVAHSDRPSL